MRSSRLGFLILLAAIVVLNLIAGVAVRAQSQQVKGEIESIGFGNQYRPDAHTPMIVRINPGSLDTGLYELQVHQKDLDGDDVIYYRDISITGGESGREQRYWMDFLPNPTELPDFQRGEQIRDLQNDLPVYLTTTGGKQLSLLKVTSTIESLDPKPGGFATRRGTKLILCVTDGTRQPAS